MKSKSFFLIFASNNLLIYLRNKAMKLLIVLICALFFTFHAFSQNTRTDLMAKSEKSDGKYITDANVEQAKEAIGNVADKQRLEKGVSQVAMFWQDKDGSQEEYIAFCKENYINDPKQLETTFNRLQTFFETLFGHFNKISLDLKVPMHLDIGENVPIDLMFASYEPGAHLNDDFFENKIAFYIILNFPYYSLKEKQELGEKWTREQWAYARLGDMFSSRIPSQLLLKEAETMAAADAYISEYNIFAGYLLNNDGKELFPKDMKLISHWNLRDEIKSQYAKPNGIGSQQMIYKVMQRIILQEIPRNVINSNKYYWNPFSNEIFDLNKKLITTTPVLEADTRYEHILNNFYAERAIDKYTPYYPSFIQRKFESEYELPQEAVEKLFIEFVSSPVIKQTAEFIKKRLNRDLQPFDIWYDGFKARSGINADKLNEITHKKYPDNKAFAKDIPNMLVKLGFDKTKADFIASKIEVDGARGAGHAWGAQMHSENAHLRTRISDKGMDYKGYNIAVHEFGHTVEQTLTLHDVDNYMMSGVPNTAFTEAFAFIFQHRDLDLLGMSEPDKNQKHFAALDNLWSCYEIMGVSLVDMKVWKWLYEHPEASKTDLKQAVIAISKEVWNRYFAPVFGIKDQLILGIYSHMIDTPLYLSAYPIGHLIEFQIEEQIENKNLAIEMNRMCSQGRLIPELWMEGAVGSKISIKPTINAAEKALKAIGK